MESNVYHVTTVGGLYWNWVNVVGVHSWATIDSLRLPCLQALLSDRCWCRGLGLWPGCL